MKTWLIVAVLHTTQAAVKLKPEKKIQDMNGILEIQDLIFLGFNFKFAVA